MVYAEIINFIDYGNNVLSLIKGKHIEFELWAAHTECIFREDVFALNISFG